MGGFAYDKLIKEYRPGQPIILTKVIKAIELYKFFRFARGMDAGLCHVQYDFYERDSRITECGTNGYRLYMAVAGRAVCSGQGLSAGPV